MKPSTAEIHRKIVAIGKALGFEVKEEYSFFYEKEDYVPRHDIVWCIKNEYDLSRIAQNVEDVLYRECLKEIPFATFEIEGSATSSKNQIGNMLNLSMSPSFFNFIIVNNEEAGNEKDTFRRALKIYNTYQSSLDIRNLFILDWFHIKELDALKYKKITTFNKNIVKKRKGTGGETVSEEIFEKMNSCGMLSFPLSIYYDWEPEIIRWLYSRYEKLKKFQTPEELDFLLLKKYLHNPADGKIIDAKSMKDVFYVPKIDIAAGLYISEEIYAWFKDISSALQDISYLFPYLQYFRESRGNDLFLPLIAYEIESGSTKHMNGGVLNSSKYSMLGFIVSNIDISRNVNFFRKQLGIKNVFFIKV